MRSGWDRVGVGMNYLIDTSGRWWRWPSELLAERLGYPDPDFDLAGYAARNLGYVWLEVREDVTLLQFRAGMLSPAVLDVLRPYLRKAIRERPVGLVYFASGWLEEAFINVDALLARVDELAALREPRMRDLFIRKSHQPLGWTANGHRDLAGLFDVWRYAGGSYTDAVEGYLRRTELRSRTVQVEAGDDRLLRIVDSGAGFTVYDNFSFKSCVGRMLTDQPDKAYGRWIESIYSHCFSTGDPVVDEVDAIVEQPGHDPRRRRYQRVILRWKTPDGRTMLTGSSLVDAGISIPIDVSKL